MKKQKLYIKLPNGRYTPYVEEEQDHRLYRKQRGKFIPCEMNMEGRSLTEGVWVITNCRSCTSYANGQTIYETYKCFKASDIIEAPSLAELGGYEKLASYLFQHWNDVDNTCVDTICKSVVGILMKYKPESK